MVSFQIMMNVKLVFCFTPDGQTNFYTVLLHGIGDTLGFEHSPNNYSIMYAYNKAKVILINELKMICRQFNIYIQN
jgi:hypothetical protein